MYRKRRRILLYYLRLMYNVTCNSVIAQQLIVKNKNSLSVLIINVRLILI